MFKKNNAVQVFSTKDEDKNISAMADSISFNMDYISRRNPELSLEIYRLYLQALDMQDKLPILVDNERADRLLEIYDKIKLEVN